MGMWDWLKVWKKKETAAAPEPEPREEFATRLRATLVERALARRAAARDCGSDHLREKLNARAEETERIIKEIDEGTR